MGSDAPEPNPVFAATGYDPAGATGIRKRKRIPGNNAFEQFTNLPGHAAESIQDDIFDAMEDIGGEGSAWSDMQGPGAKNYIPSEVKTQPPRTSDATTKAQTEQRNDLRRRRMFSTNLTGGRGALDSAPSASNLLLGV